MSKLKLSTILIALFALSVFPAFGQMDWDDGYNSYQPMDNLQTKDIPAGFVNEPGSQLIYLLDTGINAEEMFGEDENFSSYSMSDYGYDAPVNQNYISMTNTSPSQAVTVHFRYFNSDCQDFFDFLVVLTCNDTMMIDPFDFVVPGAGNLNVSERFFTGGATFDAIPAETFGDGRFLLFVTASADVKYDYAPAFAEGWDADYEEMDLIPYEFANYREELLSSHCAAWTASSAADSGELFLGTYDAYGNTEGFSDDNLHILNASAISFNYLIGFQTVAKVGDLGQQAAYMTQAGTRPAVVIDDQYEWSNTDGPSGVGAVNAPTHALLTGAEYIYTDGGDSTHTVVGGPDVDGVVFALRQEAHGGDMMQRMDIEGDAIEISQGGALGWELFPTAAMPAENQVANLISFMDNYNGYSNPKSTIRAYDDLSYNIQPVVTVYGIKAFNNSEDPWETDDPEGQPIVSPVTPVEVPITYIGVKCISTYQIDPDSSLNDAELETKFGELTLADVFSMNQVSGTGGKTLEGFLEATPAGSANEQLNEVGPGWIRLSRIFTTRSWYEPGTDAGIDDPVVQTWYGFGGPSGDDADPALNVGYVYGPSIFTAGQANYVFENFGAGKWLSTVAVETYQED